MRRLLLLVILSALYSPGFCQSVPKPPPLPPSVAQIHFVFDRKDGRTKALQAVLLRVPAPWFTLRPGSLCTGPWRVCVASSDAEWRAWKVRYLLTPDDPPRWVLDGETLYDQNLILIRGCPDAPGIFAHECCHALLRDHFTQGDKAAFESEWRREIRSGAAASNYAKSNWEEGTAEAFRCYFVDGLAPKGAIELFRHVGGK